MYNGDSIKKKAEQKQHDDLYSIFEFLEVYPKYNTGWNNLYKDIDYATLYYRDQFKVIYHKNNHGDSDIKEN